VKYLVDVAGERVEVTLDGGAATVDGASAAAHLADVEGTSVRLVTIGGAQHRVVARRVGARGGYVLWMDGWRFEVEALDERTRAIRELSAAAAGPAGLAPVIAPMPGLIVRVHVAVGDRVRAGQGIVVMEAMKMENELRAPADGVVRAIAAVTGQAVEKGTVLVEFDAGS
jgi:acetyl/propionyl-CoA carboxylase alpha subunit